MAVFQASNDGVITRPNQQVYIDGLLRSDVVCTSISQSFGVAGTTAQLLFPTALFDDNNATFYNSFVRVVSTDSNGGFTACRFAGYITSYSPTLSATTDGVGLAAASILALADKLYLGGHYDANTFTGLTRKRDAVHYPEFAYKNGVKTRTNWSPKSILEDWFTSRSQVSWKGGGGLLGSNWRAKIALGDVALLDDKTVALGDRVYRNATLREGLEDLLGLFGDLQIRESFDAAGKCLINFVRLGAPDPYALRLPLVLGNYGDVVTSQSNVATVNKSVNSDGVINRVVAQGKPRSIQLTLTTFDANPANRLEEWWDASYESILLANPDAYKQGTVTKFYEGTPEESIVYWKPEYQWVFRRYRLPKWLRDQLNNRVYTLRGSLVVERNDGTPLPIQAFYYPGLTEVGTYPQLYTSSVPSDPRVPLPWDCELHLDEGYILFRRPALYLESYDIENKVVPRNDATGSFNVPVGVPTFAQAEVALTLVIENDTRMASVQTTAALSNFDPIKEDGLTLQLTNETFRYEQLGTGGDFKLYDADGNEVECTYNVFAADEAIETSLFEYPAGVNQVEVTVKGNDDRKALRLLAKNILARQPKDRITYNVTLPACLFAYEVGEYIRVHNEASYQDDAHQITGVTYNLFPSPSTTISTSNEQPLQYDGATIIPNSLYSQQQRNLADGPHKTFHRAAFGDGLSISDREALGRQFGTADGLDTGEIMARVAERTRRKS